MTAPRNIEPRATGNRLDLASLPKPPAWMDDAACLGFDPELFFPEKTGPRNKIVNETCGGCPVRLQCLEYAIDHNESNGIWAGHSFSSSKRPRRKNLPKTA